VTPEDCFTPLKEKAVEVPAYIKWLINEKPDWQEHFSFQAFPIPLEFIDIEPALKQLDQVWRISRLGLLRIERMTVYDWHVDQERESCVNLLYSLDNNSHTLFGTQRDQLNKDVIELKYAPDTFYLFNNQVEHTVINLDGPRYLFSLYFEKEKNYHSLKKLIHG
jgi:hypothetical protein